MARSKANKDSVKKMSHRIDKMFELEHVDYLQNNMIPRLKQFGNNVDSFHKTLKEVKECQRRFDETISKKANKS